ncbi:MAG: MmcQ/YjbR family DNA-binding protein [Saprospiraceae bacterium]|nr:MmcQ/YjbR family DNA-binding protein [Saprospiraceae bacterium]
MNIETFRDYCLSKQGTSDDLPFDEHTLVFRVVGKIFAITRLSDTRLSVNLKCDPAKSVDYRDQYPEIEPGYHMNKKHWNTVDFEGELSSYFLRELIDHSYELVVKGLKKSERDLLETL